MTEALSRGSFAKVLAGDLAALREAVTRSDWQDLAIFANRFTSDASLFRAVDTDGTCRLVGLYLRIVADDAVQAIGRLRGDSQPTEPFEDVVATFLGNIAEHLPAFESNFQALTSAFYEFERQVSHFQQSPAEQMAYQSSESLRGVPRDVLTEFIIANADAIRRPATSVEDGVLNEFSRLGRVFPFDQRDLCFFTGVKGFGFLSSYYRFLYGLDDDLRPLDKAALVSEKEVRASELVSFVRDLRSTPEADCWKVTRAAATPWIDRWRELFILNMQIPAAVFRPVPAPTPPAKKAKPSKR